MWISAPEPPDLPGLSGLADELGLGTELPALLNEYVGKWVEYGVVEAAYANAHPDDFAMLVERYGHTAVAKKSYTVSSFLSGTLGRLSKRGDVLLSWRKPTGRWGTTRESPGGHCHPRHRLMPRSRGSRWDARWTTSRERSSGPN